MFYGLMQRRQQLSSRSAVAVAPSTKWQLLSWELGTALLWMIFVAAAIGTLEACLGRPPDGWALWIGALSAVAYVLFNPSSRGSSISSSLSRIAALGATLLLMGYLSNAAPHDCSWDGPAYHAEEVIQIHDGWNPLHHSMPLIEEQNMNPWLTSYVRGFPKTLPVLSASFWRVYGTFRAAVIPLWLIMVASAFLLIASIPWAGFGSISYGSILVASVLLNPISIVELFTLENDHVLSCLFLALLCLAAGCFRKAPCALATLAITAALFVTTKYPAVIFVSVGIVAAVISGIMYRRSQLFQLAAALTFGSLLGMLTLGYSSYVENLVHEKNPFYPIPFSKSTFSNLAGYSDPENLGVYAMTPIAFRVMNRFEKLAYSTFSASTYDLQGPAELRSPFRITRDELSSLGYTTIRAGFGPLFRLMIAVAIIAFIVIVARRRRPAGSWFLAITAVLLTSVLAHPENWWARFVPQFWYVPLAIAAALGTAENKLLRVPGMVIMFSGIVNAGLFVGFFYPFVISISDHAEGELRQLSARGEAISVNFDTHRSWRVFLKENKIPYTEAPILSCPQTEQHSFCTAERYCVSGQH